VLVSCWIRYSRIWFRPRASLERSACARLVFLFLSS